MLFDNKFSEDPNYEPKRQILGHLIAISGLIIYILISFTWPQETNLLVGAQVIKFTPTILDEFLCKSGSVLGAIFCAVILFFPGYLGGNPEFLKLIPLLVSYILFATYAIKSNFETSSGSGLWILIVLHFIGGVILMGAAIFLYVKDDSNPSSWCLWTKPWVYKLKEHANKMPYGFQPHGYQGNTGNPPSYAHGQIPLGRPPMPTHPMTQGYPPHPYPQAQAQIKK